MPQLYRAYFVHNRNLAHEDVLLEAVKDAGLDGEAARAALRDRSFSKMLDAEWQRAGSYRISGVPAFICGAYQITGFHPAAELGRFLDHVAANPR